MTNALSPGSRKWLLAISAVATTVICALLLAAQEGAPKEFDVVSIKPNNSGPRRTNLSPFSYLPGGRFTAVDVTLVDLIQNAYSTRRIQMRGGPDWIDSERFDVIAKAETSDANFTRDEWNQMIRALLEDRFKLAMHQEMQEMEVYALALGKTQPKLQEPKEGEPTNLTGGPRGQMIFTRMPIIGLVNTLSNMLRVPVMDDTGIKGFFDFTLDPLQFAAEQRGGPDPPGAFGDLALTAVQEELGFKVVRRKEPVEITVVDHAERPSPN